MTRLTVAALASGAVATAAFAATPEEGTISKSEPETGWSGTLTSSGTYYNAWAENPSIPCQNPPQGATTCDPFTLKLAESGSVLLTVNLQSTAVQGNNGGAGIRIEKPDGSVVYVQGESGPNFPLELDLDDAEKGDYLIHTVASYVCCGPTDYIASARMKGAGQPAQGDTPPPTPQGEPPAPSGGGEQPQPQPAPPQEQRQPSTAAPRDFVLTAKAPRVSARKARKARSFRLSVRTSRPVQQIAATLKKGKRTLSRSTVKAFKGKGTIKVKVPRTLRPGSYQLLLVGTDNGVSVARTLKLRVRR